MDYLNQYSIKLSGLKDGIFHYEFSIDGRFFEYFNYDDINNCDLKVNLELKKIIILILLK